MIGVLMILLFVFLHRKEEKRLTGNERKGLLRECDMVDTPLCKHYQTRKTCHYGETHGVTDCPYHAFSKEVD